MEYANDAESEGPLYLIADTSASQSRVKENLEKSSAAWDDLPQVRRAQYGVA